MVQFINVAQITNEEAVWKTYPDPKYPFIEANQFGDDLAREVEKILNDVT